MAKGRKRIVTWAFIGLAALGLASGIASRARGQAPKGSAYSYTSSGNGTASGKVGDGQAGLEYVVHDISSPKARVVARMHGISARADFDSARGESGFSAQANIGKSATVRGESYFSGRSEGSRISYEAAFSSWLESVAFSYTESIGKAERGYFSAGLGLKAFGQRVNWRLGYDLMERSLDLGRIRFS